jgi:hypothetical protein
MSKADSTESYTLADTTPKTSAADLKLWWHRDVTIWTRYFAYKVKRTLLEQGEDGMVFLHFKLAHREDLPDFKVELTRQYTHVWPDLPSTIQLAKQDNLYGFLMLSETWEKSAQSELAKIPDYSNVRVVDLREGGEKWPLAARNTRALFKAMRESAGLPPLVEKLFFSNR